MPKKLIHAWMLSATVALLTGTVLSASAEDGWSWRVTPLYRGGMDVEVSGSSYTQQGAIDGYRPGRNFVNLPGFTEPVDDITQVADRTFDDGRVAIGIPTITGIPPLSIDPGTVTWNFAYDQAGQYNAGAQTLTFTRLSQDSGMGSVYSSQPSPLRNTPIYESDDLNAFGLEFSASRTVRQGERFRIDLATGLSGAWGAEGFIRSQPYQERVVENGNALAVDQEVREVYVYNDTYNVIPATSAPYDVGYAGPGAIFPVLPASREVQRGTLNQTVGSSSTRSWLLHNQVDLDIDLDQYRFWFGPRIVMDLGETVEIFLLPRVSLTYADARADRTEVLYIAPEGSGASEVARWNDSSDEDLWTLGAGLTAGLDFFLSDNWFSSIQVSADWIADDLELDAGPNRAVINLDSYEVGISVGRKI